MHRLAVGILIAIAALVMSGSLGGKLRAAEGPAARAPAAPGLSSPGSERILSLVVALEALRAAPELLDRSKV